MSGRESQRSRQRSSKLKQTLTVCVLLLVWYVLLIGPLFWSYYEALYLNGPTWVLVFFEPLRQLSRIPFVADLIDQYILWWIT